MDQIDTLTQANRFALVHHNPRICPESGRATPNFAVVSCHDDAGAAEDALTACDHDAIEGFYHVHGPAHA